jgi:hypothetical protein
LFPGRAVYQARLSRLLTKRKCFADRAKGAINKRGGKRGRTLDKRGRVLKVAGCEGIAVSPV